MAGRTRKDQQALSDRGGGKESGAIDAQLVRNRKTEDLAGGWGRVFVREFVV